MDAVMPLLLALPLAFGAAGVVIGRWWVVLAALATWAGLAIYLVVNDGWYGHGWGEFGIAFHVISALATVAAASLGVGARRLMGRTTGDWHSRTA
jgi:hypothetical protein